MGGGKVCMFMFGDWIVIDCLFVLLTGALAGLEEVLGVVVVRA